MSLLYDFISERCFHVILRDILVKIYETGCVYAKNDRDVDELTECCLLSFREKTVGKLSDAEPLGSALAIENGFWLPKFIIEWEFTHKAKKVS